MQPQSVKHLPPGTSYVQKPDNPNDTRWWCYTCMEPLVKLVWIHTADDLLPACPKCFVREKPHIAQSEQIEKKFNLVCARPTCLGKSWQMCSKCRNGFCNKHLNTFHGKFICIACASFAAVVTTTATAVGTCQGSSGSCGAQAVYTCLKCEGRFCHWHASKIDDNLCRFCAGEHDF